ncbi:Small-conductance mechanosensitive channel [Loktanella sp. DSM 29012]|uniref:Small-conductance mechanosensitive channel n=1 Tax=Loktanella gaetbuli TaxID=2881335 RepID=A0ABS8BTL7_9RHOB|nr:MULTISPECIES: mechanosensitive ion channel family protein [Loktanella]MCB5198929.1 mechanosensitive ion channel family protein [Loktanella gaetbuli]SEP69275.1 Small-conductance mechanosensitive channel [Loktanella sp. DSM 29012]
MNNIDVTETLFATLSNYINGLIAALPRIGLALALILLTWCAVAIVRMLIGKFGRRLNLRQNLKDVFALVASTAIWLIGILIALAVVFPSITPGKALTTLGLGSVAIGFAFKDTFENFLAGILILLREPFSIGDYIEVDGHEGRIEDITIRDSRVRMTDGQLIVMPNHTLFSNPVTVRTNRDLRRTTVMCGVAYDADVDEARSVITRAVKNVETVRDDVKDVQIFAQAFGASSIDFEVTWWTGSRPIDIRTSRDQVVGAVKRALDDAGIEIPFTYQTLTFNEPLQIEQIATAQPEKAQG